MLVIRKMLPVVIRRPKLTLILSLTLAALCSAGLTQLKPNNDYKAFFQADDPWLQASENIQDTYTRDQNIMLVVRNKQQTLFTEQGMHCLWQATDSAWELPFVTRVDSVANFQHSQAIADDLLIRDLIEAEAIESGLSPSYIAQTQAAAVNEPQLLNRLVSADGRTAGINLTLHFQTEDKAEIAAAAEAARNWNQALEKHCPDTERKLSGIVMINEAIANASQHDMMILGPLMFIMMVLMMAALFRSCSAVFGSVLVILLSISSGLGVAGWLGYQMTPTLAIAPTMMMTMAIADCVHLVSGIRDARVRQGLNDAIVSGVKLNAMPIAITSLTTAIGFLGMRVADNPPIVHLGTVAAIGVTAAMIYSLTLLPAWLCLSRASLSPQPEGRSQKLVGLGRWVVSRKRAIILLTAVLVAFMSWSASRNQATEDLVKYFKTSTDIRQATEFSLDHLTGMYQIQFSLATGESNGIAEPAYLNTLDQFAQWFMQQDGVLQVSHVADIVKRLNQNMHGDDETWYRVPEQRELAAQYLLMYQMSLPFGLTLENLVTADFDASRFVVTLGRVESAQIRELEESAYRWLEQNAPQMAVNDGLQNRGAGPAMMYAHTASKISGTMTKATFIALLGISVLLCLALRSLGWGLLSMIPNLVPAIMAFGIWGWINGHISMTVAMVSTMTLGIVVDDTVHFLSKYLYARRRMGMAVQRSLDYAYSTVGIALVITTAVLVSGFAVMSLSPFEPSARMSELALITIITALVFDLLFLPALISAVDRNKATADQTRLEGQLEETVKPEASTAL